MDLNELRRAYGAKVAEAKAIAEQYKGREAEMPEADEQKLTAALGAADALKAKIALAERIGGHDAFLGEMPAPQAAHLGWRDAAPNEGMPDVDAKAWREVEVKLAGGESRKYRVNIPLAVQSKGYGTAFEAYARKGYSEMGPQDRKTLSEGVDNAGGFLVPEDFQMEVLRKLATAAVMRQNARVIQTSRDVAKWPRVKYTDDDKYTSPVRMTWTGETPSSSTVHRVTDPVFGALNIPVFTTMASIPLTNDLLEDAAFDVMGISSDLLAEGFALGEEDAFTNGNGTAQPMGLVTMIDAAEGPVSVVSGAAADFTYDGIINLEAALPAQYERNAKFMASKSTLSKIRLLKDGQQQPLWPIVNQYGALGIVPANLLGYPIVKNEFMPAVAANKYPLILGDLAGYVIVDRVGFSVQRLSERYAEDNITLLLARKRVGGHVAEPYRIKAQKISA